ncbi:hypothetical protein J6590_000023 [Homalodisca vitripennis]|nr:hypothetical protein J6590_000023 [Homalodisca vitripennis]
MADYGDEPAVYNDAIICCAVPDLAIRPPVVTSVIPLAPTDNNCEIMAGTDDFAATLPHRHIPTRPTPLPPAS